MMDFLFISYLQIYKYTSTQPLTVVAPNTLHQAIISQPYVPSLSKVILTNVNFTNYLSGGLNVPLHAMALPSTSNILTYMSIKHYLKYTNFI